MADPFEILSAAVGFEWDKGNSEKSWIKHGVSQPECEQLFLNQPLLVAADVTHSASEPRFFALGQTDKARRIFAVFTVRGLLIRIISARDMNRREKKEYDDAQGEEGNAQDPKV